MEVKIGVKTACLEILLTLHNHIFRDRVQMDIVSSLLMDSGKIAII